MNRDKKKQKRGNHARPLRQGQRVLVKSQGHGNHAALAVTIAFDAPRDAREFVLKVKEFPLVRIELPVK